MKVLIIGIGNVGYTLAEKLSAEAHDVTVIDTSDESLLRPLEALDVLCLRGNGASIRLLREAGVARTDVVIATTNSDEKNMVCCLTARKLGARFTVARIRDTVYADEVSQLQLDLGINMVINPEFATAAQIARLLRFPDVLDVDAFCWGRVELVGFEVPEGTFLTSGPLQVVMKNLKGISILFCALQRGSETVIPNGATVLQPGDCAYVIGAIKGISQFFKKVGLHTASVRNVFAIGGGRVTEYLARILTTLGMGVKIVESDRARCDELSGELSAALVVHGDGTDQEILASENMHKSDAFVALTGSDEYNIISSLYAVQKGVPRVITKINRQSFPELVQALGLQEIIVPKLITTESILRFVRGVADSQDSRMTTLYHIAGGRVSAAEFIVTNEAHHLNVPLKDLRLKRGVLIAVILRGGQVIIPEGRDYLSAGDNVIIVSVGNLINDIDDIHQELNWDVS